MNVRETRDVFVLVHGAWDGGWIWQPLRHRLLDAGADVYAPSLTGSADRSHLASPAVGLGTYVDDIVNLITFEELRHVILVGFSFGGMTATGVATQVADRIAHLVYLDAFVPRDGQSFMDLVPPETVEHFQREAERAGDGWRIPEPATPDWRPRALPLRAVTDVVHVDESTMPPRTYIRCVSDEPGGHFDDAARRAQEEGWGHYEIRSGHNAMDDAPDELAAILLRIAGRR